VRAATPRREILYRVAAFTRHANNNPRVGARDGASLYDNPV
jgi:hypothetical protein